MTYRRPTANAADSGAYIDGVNHSLTSVECKQIHSYTDADGVIL